MKCVRGRFVLARISPTRFAGLARVPPESVRNIINVRHTYERKLVGIRDLNGNNYHASFLVREIIYLEINRRDWMYVRFLLVHERNERSIVGWMWLGQQQIGSYMFYRGALSSFIPFARVLMLWVQGIKGPLLSDLLQLGVRCTMRLSSGYSRSIFVRSYTSTACECVWPKSSLAINLCHSNLPIWKWRAS